MTPFYLFGLGLTLILLAVLPLQTSFMFVLVPLVFAHAAQGAWRAYRMNQIGYMRLTLLAVNTFVLGWWIITFKPVNVTVYTLAALTFFFHFFVDQKRIAEEPLSAASLLQIVPFLILFAASINNFHIQAHWDLYFICSGIFLLSLFRKMRQNRRLSFSDIHFATIFATLIYMELTRRYLATTYLFYYVAIIHYWDWYHVYFFRNRDNPKAIKAFAMQALLFLAPAYTVIFLQYTRAASSALVSSWVNIQYVEAMIVIHVLFTIRIDDMRKLVPRKQKN